MTDAPAPVPLTVAEFHEAYAPEDRDVLIELIHGEAVQKMPTYEHGYIVARLIFLFGLYFEGRGELPNLGPEIRFEMPDDDENSRLPDLSIFEQDRPIQARGAVTSMPMIAIEVQSPDDTRPALRDRAEYYLEHGAKQAWVVYPKTRKIEIMTLDDMALYGMGDTITLDDDVLPGFTLEVAKVFNYPRAE